MVNLHAVVSPLISSINPPVRVDVKVSTGYSTQADGTRVPSYSGPYSVQAQVQPLTGRDLMQIDGLNLQGTLKAIYICGSIDAAVRSDLKGGDLVIMPDGTVWLVAQMLEAWGLTAGWSKACIVLQNGS